jgi:hypothetical protein
MPEAMVAGVVVGRGRLVQCLADCATTALPPGAHLVRPQAPRLKDAIPTLGMRFRLQRPRIAMTV